MWKCKQCGECCKHISILAPNIGWEEVAYLEAHGCKYIEGHIVIPAKCEYLEMAYRKQDESGFIYQCKIHKTKFSMCKKYGEKECININEKIKKKG